MERSQGPRGQAGPGPYAVLVLSYLLLLLAGIKTYAASERWAREDTRSAHETVDLFCQLNLKHTTAERGMSIQPLTRII